MSTPETAPDGPYSPELAQAFRAGARHLLDCNTLGTKFDLADRARVEEGPDGGVWVHLRLYVSDDERPLMPGEGGVPTLDEFRATGRACDDLEAAGVETGAPEGEPPRAGRIYGPEGSGLHIDGDETEGYCLTIENDSRTGPLAELEAELFEWALSAGHFAPRTFAHEPDACPSMHWNGGDDICADCGADLQA